MDWNLIMGRIIMKIVQVAKIDGHSKLNLSTFFYEVMANVNNLYKYLLVQFNIILYKIDL